MRQKNKVSRECYIKIFLVYSFNEESADDGNFALQSKWEIANSLLAAAKWGNQTLGRIYSLRSTLFSISMHSSAYFLRYPAKNETLWRNSWMYFHTLPSVFIQVPFRYVFVSSRFYNGTKKIECTFALSCRFFFYLENFKTRVVASTGSGGDVFYEEHKLVKLSFYIRHNLLFGFCYETHLAVYRNEYV